MKKIKKIKWRKKMTPSRAYQLGVRMGVSKAFQKLAEELAIDSDFMAYVLTEKYADKIVKEYEYED